MVTMNSDDVKRGAPAVSSLEDRLRRLPQPPVPPMLERRLLAALPGSERSADRRGRPLRAIVLAGVGIAAAFLLLIRFLPTDLPPERQRICPGALGSTSPEYILAELVENRMKETDPCYILPHNFEAQ
jgi:hypothetical protein